MKLDMHCHTAEGSLDGKVAIEDYMNILISKGYQGMLVTDHNSYNGFRYYRDCLKEKYPNFRVFKGIEYDTIDAGHVLVILPEGVKPRIVEVRGLPVKLLQEIVHRHGGVLGPAHPCGERHLSFTHTKAFRKHPDLFKDFDFIETFNSCESEESNALAQYYANKYNLPGFGGSDSHNADCVGCAFTNLEEDIHCESELIEYIKAKKPTTYGGVPYMGTLKDKLGFFNHFLVEGFWFYNHFAALFKSRKRRLTMKLLKLQEKF